MLHKEGNRSLVGISPHKYQRKEEQIPKAELWIDESHGCFDKAEQSDWLTAHPQPITVSENTSRSTEQTFNDIKYSNAITSVCFNQKTQNLQNPPDAAVSPTLPGDERWQLLWFTPRFVSLCSECDVTPFKIIRGNAPLCLALALQTVEVLCGLSGKRKSTFTFQFSSW